MTAVQASTERRLNPVDAGRVFFGWMFVLIVAGSVVLVARVLTETQIWANVFAVALGLAVVPLLASPIEWMVHRFVYHEAVVPSLTAIHRVHVAHHFSFFPTWRYTTNGPARRLAIRKVGTDIRRTAMANARVRATHFVWYMSFGLWAIWIPTWLLTHNEWFVVGEIMASAVVSNLFIAVHDTIHRPGSHRIIERQSWFAFLDRHHYIHHVDLGANLNFLLPLGDALFGTLRREMTEAELREHGSLEAAKSRPVGVGERARVTAGR
ncbi:MAG: hypothetical protein RL391_1300 [Actinomycetota bacterium]|jgi:hypothetical protein